jgi:hypothetical protein
MYVPYSICLAINFAQQFFHLGGTLGYLSLRGDLVDFDSLRLTSPKELALPYKESYFRPITFISQM